MAMIMDTGNFNYPEGEGNAPKQELDASIRKVYIEPTTDCNLTCQTCMRHTWEEPGGEMHEKTFNKLLTGLREINTLEKVAVWGIGEPLTHPCIAEMIKAVKELGVQTELITNAMLLDEPMARSLIEAGLDTMVVSIDSTSQLQFSEIRTGSDLNSVLTNVRGLNQLKSILHKSNPEIGVEFTAMKKNVGELSKLRELSANINASFIIVTNVLPYSEENKDQVLYSLSATNRYQQPRSKWNPEIMLPRMDIRPEHIEAMGKISFEALNLGPNPYVNRNYNGTCPFIERGAIAITYDGELSPCVPLMHTYDCYIQGNKKRFVKHSFGNIHRNTLLEIWNQEDYQTFRQKLIDGVFSPCIECGGCDLSESNLEDCYGNLHPTCGDCLWAKGVIQCP